MAWTTQKYINLRATQAYVTDGTNQTSLNEDDVAGGVYPISVTLDSDTFNIGFTDPPQYRDRDSGADARLAGIGFGNNDGAGVRELRINTPAANIGVRLAFGDPAGDHPYQEWAIYNDTTLLETIVVSTNTPATQWRDAFGTLHTSNANWIANNAEKTYNITSGILWVKYCSVAAQTDVTCLATVGFRQIATAGSPRNLLLLGVG
jgi:hypothetical protein